MISFGHQPVFWSIVLVWTAAPLIFVVVTAQKRGGYVPWLAIVLMGMGVFGVFSESGLTLAAFYLMTLGFLNPLWALLWWLVKGRRLKRVSAV